MKYFKHYSNALTSNKLSKLMAVGGKIIYLDYWLLLELLSQKFDGKDTFFILDKDIVRTYTRHYTHKSLRKSLECIANVGLISIKIFENHLEIDAPILLDLMARDYKYDKQKRVSSDTKNKNKNKNKSNTMSSDDDAPTNKVEQIASYWNQMAGQFHLTKIKVLNPQRRKKVSTALKQVGDLTQWEKIIKEVPQDNFRLGDNDRGWKANFDWLFRNNNYLNFHVREREFSC